MLHPSLHALYVPQRTLFGRLLRLAFALAGIFWFLLYAMPVEQHAVFRSGQSVIYFILLSIWGIDYLREAKRLAIVVRIANEKNSAPHSVKAEDVTAHRRTFAVVPWFDASLHILSLAMWLAMAAAIVLVVRQYISGILALLQ